MLGVMAQRSQQSLIQLLLVLALFKSVTAIKGKHTYCECCRLLLSGIKRLKDNKRKIVRLLCVPLTFLE